jgi:hypothetical protein
MPTNHNKTPASKNVIPSCPHGDIIIVVSAYSLPIPGTDTPENRGVLYFSSTKSPGPYLIFPSLPKNDDFSELVTAILLSLILRIRN